MRSFTNTRYDNFNRTNEYILRIVQMVTGLKGLNVLNLRDGLLVPHLTFRIEQLKISYNAQQNNDV